MTGDTDWAWRAALALARSTKSAEIAALREAAKKAKRALKSARGWIPENDYDLEDVDSALSSLSAVLGEGEKEADPFEDCGNARTAHAAKLALAERVREACVEAARCSDYYHGDDILALDLEPLLLGGE